MLGIDKQAPKREKEVKEVIEQMRCLDKSIQSLNQAVDCLEPQLSTILSSSTPTVAEDQKEKELCPLAGELRIFRNIIEAIERCIRDKLNRIEI